ncbi:hypothetical protein D3C71_1661400 [compost metagenome]
MPAIRVWAEDWAFASSGTGRPCDPAYSISTAAICLQGPRTGQLQLLMEKAPSTISTLYRSLPSTKAVSRPAEGDCREDTRPCL